MLISTVTISESALEQDFLLNVLLQTCAQRNLVKLKKKKKADGILLESDDASVVLKQRNAIVRALALDQPPYYWAGGTNHHSSAALVAWMSVADQLSSSSSDTTLAALEDHLAHTAFLIEGTAVPTVADLDLAQALLGSLAKSGDTELGRNVGRWMRTTLSVWSDYARAVGVEVPTHVEAAVAKSAATVQPPSWWFGNASDSVQDVLAGLATKNAKAAPGKQQQQGKQQKQQQGKQQQAKKEKQPKAVKAKQQAAAQADVDISALDMRVGQIVKVWPHPEADKLFCEEIDMGNGQIRQVASGLRPYYKDSDLLNKKVLVLANLKKRNLVGFPSHGMVLCATKEQDGGRQVEVVLPDADAPLGDRVSFEGIAEQEPAPENKVQKKKIFEALAPDLKTNGEGQVVWKEAVARVGGKELKSVNGLVGAQVS